MGWHWRHTFSARRTPVALSYMVVSRTGMHKGQIRDGVDPYLRPGAKIRGHPLADWHTAKWPPGRMLRIHARFYARSLARTHPPAPCNSCTVLGHVLQADVSSSPAAGLRPDVRRDAPHARHGRRPDGHRAARRARPAQRPQAGAPRPTCRPPPRARRSTHRRGRDEACHGEVRIGAPGAMLNATCRLVVRQRSHGYGPVDPGSADRWRNAQVSRKYAPFVLARRAAQISKNVDRKSDPPKFRETLAGE